MLGDFGDLADCGDDVNDLEVSTTDVVSDCCLHVYWNKGFDGSDGIKAC